jgi:hypothetical protein
MALISRQNNLFAAEDWKVAYKAFSEVDFQAYDFDTIRTTLIEYIRTNFPETFNDYIESSEFIAIIEMLAFLSQSLTFRMDLNSRENFLETAERRDSIFKLARMLGYNPKRNIPASGLMKIEAVRTSEPLQDSIGNDINNVNVFWDDANNPESYEQFITIINAAMASYNRFSQPAKSGMVAGVNVDLYELNTPITNPTQFDFTLEASGVTRNFEIVNTDFLDNDVFFERHPNPINNFNLIYQNDGLGVSSNNTGFFVMFKQGDLKTQSFNFATPVENREVEINIPNINETDCYLQEINTDGTVINEWKKIPNTVGQTLYYNDLAFGQRNLFAVENLNNEGIKLRFPDGNFGNIPFGNFRFSYRVSDAEDYTLYPEDARLTTVGIPYVSADGDPQTLTIVFSLKEPVGNSAGPEDLNAIKDRAPETYYTQNRMVSAQDYNVFPLSKSSNIQKLKAVNKTHAGHSRFIDINDPTGTYQNVETFANDGALYSEIKTSTTTLTISDSITPTESTVTQIPLMLKGRNLNNFAYDNFREIWETETANKFDLSGLNARWMTLPVTTGDSLTGYFLEDQTGTDNILDASSPLFQMFKESNFVKFADPSDISKVKWVRIVSIDNNGLLSSGLSTSVGPVKISAKVDHGWKAMEVIATIRRTFLNTEVSAIVSELENKRTFGLGYEPTDDSWYVIANADLNKTGDWSPQYGKNTSESGLDASWLLKFSYNPSATATYSYTTEIRGQQYIIQSKNDLKFYNINNVKVADSFNTASRDQIVLTKLNFKPGGVESFTWADSGVDGNPDAYLSSETSQYYTPVNGRPNIPLRTRDTKYHDIGINWITNMGIFKNGNEAGNLFVDAQAISLQTYKFQTAATNYSGNYPNVSISDYAGQINWWPAQVNVAFTTETFGVDLYNAGGNVVYRDQLANGTVRTFTAQSNGTTLDSTGTLTGRIKNNYANVSAGTGTLAVRNWDGSAVTGRHSFVADGTGKLSQDKIEVTYKQDKRKLDNEIIWDVVDVVKYNDGYTDPRKVIVAPVDSDGDIVPNNPIQFKEFVDKDDLIFFEYYTDYDGYSYDRPLTGKIQDYRNENVLTIDLAGDTIAPTSYTSPVTLSAQKIIILNDATYVTTFNNIDGKLNGLVIYDYTNKKLYQMTKSSTNPNNVTAVITTDYFVRNGRATGQNTALQSDDSVLLKWKHVAPNDVRIDPSISNIVEMLVLTNTYYTEIQKYKNVAGKRFPLPPTSAELSTEFKSLDDYKNASDTIVYKSAEFKLLFGSDAESSVQAKFRVVKLPGTTMSDNEIKSNIIKAFNSYFNIDNWDYGETFYFTELASYVHQRLGSNIGSIVIIPKNSAGAFGDLFQVKAEPYQLFLNIATVSDIEIVDKINQQSLRADR